MTLPDAAALNELWRRAPQIAREELTAAMEESTIALQAAVAEMTPVGAHGLLRQSIHALPVQQLSDQVIGVVGTSLNYAEPVEMGTRPHMPPVEALEDWVKAKLGVEDDQVQRVAYAVARKIAVSGTPAAGMFHRGLNAMRAAIALRFEAARNRIVERLSQAGGAA